MNTTPRPNRLAYDADIDALPITEHGTYDDRPLEMIDTATIRSYISQLRARYTAADFNDPMRAALADMHSELMTEFRARTA